MKGFFSSERSDAEKTLGVSQNDLNKKRTPTKSPWAKLKNRPGGPFRRHSFLTNRANPKLSTQRKPKLSTRRNPKLSTHTKTLGVSQIGVNKKRTSTKSPWAKLKNASGDPFRRNSVLTTLPEEGLEGFVMKGFFSSEGFDGEKTLGVSQNGKNKKRTPTKLL